MPSAEDLYEQIKVALQNGDSGTACQLAKYARDMHHVLAHFLHAGDDSGDLFALLEVRIVAAAFLK